MVLQLSASAIATAFETWRARHTRVAWQPEVVDGDASVQSRFGGQPTATSEQEWPACTHCKRPMQFFVQLAFDELPPEERADLGDGIVQLFYCSTDDGSCSTWEPFSGAHEIRVIPHDDRLADVPPGVELRRKRSIVRWKPVDDLPHPEEHDGLHYDYNFAAKTVSVRCDDPDVHLDDVSLDVDVAESIALALPGDKLGGWPYWVQGAEYPHCPECGARMKLLLQIDSEDNLDYMFGDAGCAHLTYCPDHTRVFAFGWACG